MENTMQATVRLRTLTRREDGMVGCGVAAATAAAAGDESALELYPNIWLSVCLHGLAPATSMVGGVAPGKRWRGLVDDGYQYCKLSSRENAG